MKRWLRIALSTAAVMIPLSQAGQASAQRVLEVTIVCDQVGDQIVCTMTIKEN